MSSNASIDVTAPAPRVNFELMSTYIGKRVTLVGKVEGVDGNTMRLKASDDGMVTVRLQGVAPQVRGRRRVGGGWAAGGRAAPALPRKTLPLTKCPPSRLLVQATYVEVEGVVNSPNTITEESCSSYGDSFGECDGGGGCAPCLPHPLRTPAP